MSEGIVFRSALAEFFRFKRVFAWFLIAFVLIGVGKLFVQVTPSLKPDEHYSMLSTLLVFLLLPLASAIFSSAVLSQEIEQKTIVYLLTRPIPRPQLLLLRTLASALVVAMIGTIAALAVSVSIYNAGGLSNPILHRDIVAICLGALAYAALFVLISLWVNRAMIVSLLFAFAWETSVPNMPGNMYWLSISSYLTAVAQRPSVGAGGLDIPMGSFAANLGTNVIPQNTAWVVLIILILGLSWLGAWWFSHFEYLPREDAE